MAKTRTNRANTGSFEPRMTRRFWRQVHGTLLQEYTLVPSGPQQQRRIVDAVIIRNGRHQKGRPKGFPMLKGLEVYVVQTKARRLGMSVIGQAVVSRELLKTYKQPKSIIAVALCTATDTALAPIAEKLGVRVHVDDTKYRRKGRKR